MKSRVFFNTWIADRNASVSGGGGAANFGGITSNMGGATGVTRWSQMMA